MKMANDGLRKRINSAAAHIGLAVRYNKPEDELEARRLSAVAHIENQILLGRDLLSKGDCQALAEILFGVENIPQRIVQGSDIPFAEADEDEEVEDLAELL